MAKKQNIVVDQGTSFNTTISMYADDGSVLNLTGYTCSSKIKKSYTSINSISFATSISGNDGIITLSLTPEQTANVSYGRYLYDVELIDSSNNVTRVIEGIVTITPQVTT